MNALRILHFADAHIDMANYGRHDPISGLPIRVMDFLKSLDVIVDTAIAEKVDLVLFAGDAYKDRTPAPTFQREWGRRIMRLSTAGIPTLLLVGNHDLSPALGRAHALESFDTLQVPRVRVLDRPALLGPAELFDLPLQLIALPWLTRSAFLAQAESLALAPEQILPELEAQLTELLRIWLDRLDPALPAVLTAHASVQGAQFGIERSVMLGNDLVLPGSLVKDRRLDYVALGHIHLHQNLNDGQHPPVIYPGSIERVDFGEARDEKYFVIATVQRGQTQVEWRKLDQIRPFIDCSVKITEKETLMDQALQALPPPEKLRGAIVRLVVEYPREWEQALDDNALREVTAECLEFHLVKRPVSETRLRLPGNTAIGSLSPLELLDLYWRTRHTRPEEIEALQRLAAEIIRQAEES